MEILYAQAAAWTPWKNGGGLTREIISSPPGSGLAEFDWRVSTAWIEADGPFSIFPGIERTLAVLKGEGLSLLTEDGSATYLDTATPPFMFDGGVQFEAKLRSSAVLDLNVMTKRANCFARVTRIAIEGRLTIIASTGEMVLLASDTDALPHLNGVDLAPLDAIHLAHGDTVTLQSQHKAAIIHAVELIRVAT